jgi:hypothetical protein
VPFGLRLSKVFGKVSGSGLPVGCLLISLMTKKQGGVYIYKKHRLWVERYRFNLRHADYVNMMVP